MLISKFTWHPSSTNFYHLWMFLNLGMYQTETNVYTHVYSATIYCSISQTVYCRSSSERAHSVTIVSWFTLRREWLLHAMSFALIRLSLKLFTWQLIVDFVTIFWFLYAAYKRQRISFQEYFLVWETEWWLVCQIWGHWHWYHFYGFLFTQRGNIH